MALPPPPSGLDLSEDRRVAIVATSVITWVLGVVAIVLRIASRRIQGTKLWLDDWLIIAALIPSCAHVFGMGGYAVSRGLGQHIWVTPPDSIYAWAIGLFIAELNYFLTLMCVQWSILAFYWRSFSIQRSIRVPIWILATITLFWGIAVIGVTIFQCQPTNAFWERFNPNNPLKPSDYHCGIDDVRFFYGNAIPTIVTDLLMLALPVPYIMRLHLRNAQKIALAGIFLVGIFVTIVSVVRLNYLLRGDLHDPDLTWNFIDIGLWSVVEGNIALVCSCLPFLRPVLNKFTGGILHLSSLHSKGQATTDRITESNPLSSVNKWGEASGQGQSSSYTKTTGNDDSSDNSLLEAGEKELKRNLVSVEVINSCPAQVRQVQDQAASQAGGIMVTREIHLG